MHGCAVSRRYINVCNCDMFSVVNVYLDHLKFCVVCINSRRYVCCSECNVVSNESNEPSPSCATYRYSSLTLLMKECYEEEVQPYRKANYKPIIYIYIYI